MTDRAPEEAERGSGRSPPFLAKHAGRCAVCDRRIRIGEPITYSRIDRSIWCSPLCPKSKLLGPDELGDLADALLAQLRGR